MSLGKVLITGGAGVVGSTITDQLVKAGRGRDRRVRQPRPRTPREPRGGDCQRVGLPRVGRHQRHRGRASAMEGCDVVFHQAAIRITQCAEEPRLAFDVMVVGTFNVAEAAVAAEVGKVVVGIVRRRLRHGRDVPDAGAPPSLGESHVVRRGEGLRRDAPHLPRDVRPRLRRVAVLQRVRAPDGDHRRAHRGAGPLDGTHRQRPAPLILGDGSQTVDFVYVDDVAARTCSRPRRR